MKTRRFFPVLMVLGALAGPALGQTVSEKAQIQIAKEKDLARVNEAKRLLQENAEAWARITKNNDRLAALDAGADAEKPATTGYTSTMSNCCIAVR